MKSFYAFPSLFYCVSHYLCNCLFCAQTHIFSFVAGITLPLSFNVSGSPSPQFSYISTAFAPGGYAPGTPVSFNIQVVDGQGIVPTGFFGGGGGSFPFRVTLSQSTIVGGSNATFPVSFTTTQQGNGVWQVTCTPTRFLPITGSLKLRNDPTCAPYFLSSSYFTFDRN